MAYDQDNFLGLTREPDRDLAGDEFRTYATPADDQIADAGTHPCEHEDPNGVVTILRCPSLPTDGVLEVAGFCDLTAGRWVRFGTFAEDVSLTDRLSLLPTPAFVQVHIQAQYNASGGANGCRGRFDGGFVASCLDPQDGSVELDASCATAAFEFGGDMTSADHVIEAPRGLVNHYDFNGMLRRPVDGDSYAGDTTNDAYRTLIPWDEFIASPVAVITAFSGTVHTLSQDTTGATVRLWWPTPIASGHVSLVGCA